MPRSSDTVSALASALAKAQVELVNPEKSLVATLRQNEASPSEVFVMRRSQVGLMWCEKPLVGTRSRPFKQPQSIVIVAPSS